MFKNTIYYLQKRTRNVNHIGIYLTKVHEPLAKATTLRRGTRMETNQGASPAQAEGSGLQFSHAHLWVPLTVAIISAGVCL